MDVVEENTSPSSTPKLDELGKEHGRAIASAANHPGFWQSGFAIDGYCALRATQSVLSSAKHASSYTGLVPSTYHSGANERFGHITRAGSTELRTMLVQAAQHAAKKDHPFHSFHRRIRAKKGYGTATIAVAHRLARVAGWSMLVHEKRFRHRPNHFRHFQKQSRRVGQA